MLTFFYFSYSNTAEFRPYTVKAKFLKAAFVFRLALFHNIEMYLQKFMLQVKPTQLLNVWYVKI